ncbi:DUF4128 domain-containing protein [Ancylobacter sp.]|uniref:DUF4128 domain-containing protein n=1 Tax=Ancylobacter sp. TaxID=1872567 RepID=UPI003D0DC32D
MATSTEARIKALLFARLGTLTGAAGALPLAVQNVNFTPPASGKFLRVDFIPNRVDRLEIASDGAHQMRGLLQVSVMWPKGEGIDDPYDIAGAIVAAYPVDLPLWDGDLRVRVYERPAVAGVIVEDQRVMIPVTILWEEFI